MQLGMLRFIPRFPGNRGGKRRPMLVIDQRSRPGIPGDINPGTEGAGESGSDFTDARFDVLLNFRAMRAQRPFQLNAFRQDVPGIAARNARYAQHNGIQRIHVATGDALQRGNKLACQHNRVVAFMRPCGMSTFAGNADHKPIDVGIERPAAGGKFTHRQPRLVVHPEDGADVT